MDRISWKAYVFHPYVRLTSACVAIVLLMWGGYTLWFMDHRVREAFGTSNWSEPSRVFSRPLELYSGKEFSRDQLLQSLKRRGYVRGGKLLQPGQYGVSDQSVRLYRRSFHFLEGKRESRRFTVQFESGRIRGLTSRDNARVASGIRLEPVQIGAYFGPDGEDRIYRPLDSIPELLRDSLLLLEDRSFHQHHGLDPLGILRALWANLRAGRIVQGGSTLTQQLVKSRFLGNQRTWTRKLHEMILALLVEFHYDKSDILQAYVNEIYLGQQGNRAIHGFARASRFYFGTSLEELTPDQVALLVGMIRGPSHYDPRRHPGRALARRNYVLSVMGKHDLISRHDVETMSNRKLRLSLPGTGGGTAHPHFMDLVRRRLRRDYSDQLLRSGGLQIFTTFHPRVQSILEREVPGFLREMAEQNDRVDTALQVGVVIARVQTGEVLALLGGRRNRFPGFNRALDATRPIGSLVKPAIFLTALERPDTYTLVSSLSDQSFTHKVTGDTRTWSPRNFSGKHHGRVRLINALAHSYNVATARLGLNLGVNTVLETIQRLGVRSSFDTYPATLLGSASMTPLQVTQMYQTLANGGYRAPLKVIRGVRDSEQGRIKRDSLSLHQDVEPGPAYLVGEALQHTMREGTGRRISERLPNRPVVAGKTGTTQKFRDSWFVGYGQNHLITVWLGQDHYQSTGLTGSSGAGRLWARVARRLPVQSIRRNPPSSITRVWIDAESWLPSRNRCRNQRQLPFIKGSVPAEKAPCAKTVLDYLPWRLN